jgi:hypothetical protein
MPIAPRHPCSGKGPRRGRCPNLVSRGERCCPDCVPHDKAAVRRYDAERDQTDQRKFLHSRTWRAVRLGQLCREPLCQQCSIQHRDVAAVLVHHIDENELNNCDDNLLSLCTSCHEEIHKGERWGR